MVTAGASVEDRGEVDQGATGRLEARARRRQRQGLQVVADRAGDVEWWRPCRRRCGVGVSADRRLVYPSIGSGGQEKNPGTFQPWRAESRRPRAQGGVGIVRAVRAAGGNVHPLATLTGIHCGVRGRSGGSCLVTSLLCLHLDVIAAAGLVGGDSGGCRVICIAPAVVLPSGNSRLRCCSGAAKAEENDNKSTRICGDATHHRPPLKRTILSTTQ